jgi:hypothetical protein
MDKELFKVLRRHRVANVALSSKTMPMCLEITAHTIFRMHFYLQTQWPLRSRWMLDEAPWESGINQNVRAVVGLNNISRYRYAQRLEET